VENEEVLERVKADRNSLHTTKEGRVNGFVIYKAYELFSNTYD